MAKTGKHIESGSTGEGKKEPWSGCPGRRLERKELGYWEK